MDVKLDVGGEFSSLFVHSSLRGPILGISVHLRSHPRVCKTRV